MTLSTRGKVFLGLAVLLGLTLIVYAITGSDGRSEFQPTEEFRLNPWIDGPGKLDVNRAFLYIVLATALTAGAMIWIAGRMAGGQVAVAVDRFLHGQPAPPVPIAPPPPRVAKRPTRRGSLGEFGDDFG